MRISSICKQFVKFLLIIQFFSACTFSVARAADFTTDVLATYTFDGDETAKVVIDFTLQNQTALTFVSNYQIVVPDNGISGLVIQEKNEDITKEEHTDHARRVIDLTFNNTVVGQGKRRQFALEYTARSLSVRRGSARVIRLLALPGSETWENYRVRVAVPVAWGEPQLSLPGVRQATDEGRIAYDFQMTGQSELVLRYGESQTLQFSLRQPVANQSNYPAYREIILPGDQAGTTFVYRQLSPTPVDWTRLDDGSWRAYYLLDSGQVLDVSAEGYIIDGQIDRDYHLGEHFQLAGEFFNTWNVESVPEGEMVETPEIAVSDDLVWHGWWTSLREYALYFTNQTGQFWSDLPVEATVTAGDVALELERERLDLTARQTSVIIARVRPTAWWRPYEKFQAVVRVRDGKGEIINEYQFGGVAISYAAFGCLGGIVGLAAVAWSLLVAGRAGTGAVRRQGKKFAQ